MVSRLRRSVHRVGESNKARASLCGDSNRRNDTSFIPHFRQQWVRYFPWGVEANWLYIWVELDLIFGFQFSQTTEKLRKFSNEIYWPSIHLQFKQLNPGPHRLSSWWGSGTDLSGERQFQKSDTLYVSLALKVRITDRMVPPGPLKICCYFVRCCREYLSVCLCNRNVVPNRCCSFVLSGNLVHYWCQSLMLLLLMWEEVRWTRFLVYMLVSVSILLYDQSDDADAADADAASNDFSWPLRVLTSVPGLIEGKGLTLSLCLQVLNTVSCFNLLMLCQAHRLFKSGQCGFSWVV